MNRQNDIAIFKEQLGARNMLIKNQNSSQTTIKESGSVNQEFKIMHHNELSSNESSKKPVSKKHSFQQEVMTSVTHQSKELASCELKPQSNQKIKKRNSNLFFLEILFN